MSRAAKKPNPALPTISNEANEELTYEQIADALEIMTHRTPGQWVHFDDGIILAVDTDRQGSPATTYSIADVFEQYTDSTTVYDANAITTAVSLLNPALREILDLRRAQQTLTAENKRLRKHLAVAARRRSRYNIANRIIVTHDTPQPAASVSDETTISCEACNGIRPETIRAQTQYIEGPMPLCECNIDRRAIYQVNDDWKNPANADCTNFDNVIIFCD